MKINIWILLYIVLLLFIVVSEYRENNDSSQILLLHHYKIEENKALDTLILGYVEPLDMNVTNSEQWGIKTVKKIKNKAIVEEVKKIKFTDVTLKGKTLCIEKECFKLLGIFSKKNHYYASFYNKEDKQKVRTYRVGNIVKSLIRIKSIKTNSVLFKDINSTREWSIKLFDINSSKYKPKDFE